MARPADIQWVLQQARQQKLNLHSNVRWNGSWYTIWKDRDGPIWSTPSSMRTGSSAADYFYMDKGLDTVTDRVMMLSTGCAGDSVERICWS